MMYWQAHHRNSQNKFLHWQEEKPAPQEPQWPHPAHQPKHRFTDDWAGIAHMATDRYVIFKELIELE